MSRTLRRRIEFLRRRFSNKPNVIQTRAGTASLPLRSLHPHWVVGRDLCMYRCEDFSNVPRNRRRAALQLKIPLWSPFQSTGWHCVWADAVAMVWFWDKDEVRVRADAFPGAVAARARIVPETTFMPRRADGAYLARCWRGWELQCWRGDALRDAFWFAERPGGEELRARLARHGFGAAALVAHAADAAPPLGAEPWRNRQAPGEWLMANERSLAAAAVLALALAAAWQEGRLWKLEGLNAAAEAELAAIEDNLGPIAAARAEAVRLRNRNDALAGFLNTPSQAWVMSLVDQAIPSETARFYEWRYQQGELTVVVEDAEGALDTVAFVRALERQPLFDDVRVGRSRESDRVEVTLRVNA